MVRPPAFSQTTLLRRLRIYHDNTVPANVLLKLKSLGCELINKDSKGDILRLRMMSNNAQRKVVQKACSGGARFLNVLLLSQIGLRLLMIQMLIAISYGSNAIVLLCNT